MKTFRRLLQSLGTPCLALLLFVNVVEAELQSLASAAWQTVSPGVHLKPTLSDEHQQLWSQALKNAQAETGPKLENPAIADHGLTPGVARALQEQRRYLETHGAAAFRRDPVNAATRELVGDSTRKSRSLSEDPPCRQPLIRSVNGKATGVIFTPTAANNKYRIGGCFFGDAPGIVQLEVRSASHQLQHVPPISMRLDSTSSRAWSDHELNVQLDDELSGILDHPVKLVIYSAKHRRIELRGCRFVAARGSPQLLSMIPSTWVSLYPSGVGPRSIRQQEYVSPTQASGAVPMDATASSAFVVRSDPEQFGIGRDSYDFSRLSPGWVVQSVQLLTYSISCPEVVTSVQSFGHWKAEWIPRGARVAFEGSVCSSSVAPPFTSSQYAIRVWVVGPVGTQPLALVR